MRKLALSDDILMKIEKPARYIGGEVNAVTKNPDDVQNPQTGDNSMSGCGSLCCSSAASEL